jgi:hypothetical protein
MIIHGAKDIKVPVENSRMVEGEFGKREKTNLTYIV